MTVEDQRVYVLDSADTQRFVLKPKPDITPMEVLELVTYMIGGATSSTGISGPITVHFDEENLSQFSPHMMRHFEPE